MAQENHRLRPRVPFQIAAEFTVDSTTSHYAETRDISMNGLFLVSDTTYPIGTIGHLTITLSSGQERLRISARCEVTRVTTSNAQSEPSGFGVKFLDLDTDSSISLFNIIKHQTR